MKFPQLLCGLTLALMTPAPAFLGLFEGDDEPQEAPAPEERAGQEQPAEAQVARGTSALAAGDLSRAEDAFETVLERYPFTAAAGEAQFQLGRVAEARGKHEDAVVAYGGVIRRYPNSGRFNDALSAQFQLAEAAREGRIRTSFMGLARDYDRSDVISWYDGVIRAAPRSDLAPASLLALGALYTEDGQRQAAVEAYQRLVREYPESEQAPQAQLLLGDVIAGGAGGETGESRTLRSQQETLEDARAMFGDDPERAAEIEERLGQVQSRQASNDLEIAEFYEDRGNLRAASIYYREVLRYEGTREYEIASARLSQMGVDEGPIGEGVDAELRALAAEGHRLTSRPDYVGPPAPDLAAADGPGSMRVPDDLIDLDPLPTGQIPGNESLGAGLFIDEEDDLDGELPALGETADPDEEAEQGVEAAEDALARARAAVEELRRRNADRAAAAGTTGDEAGADSGDEASGEAEEATEDAAEEAQEAAAAAEEAVEEAAEEADEAVEEAAN